MSKKIKIDKNYIYKTLLKLLEIPSPTGYTDNIVHATCKELDKIGVDYDLTRRGAIRGTLKGKKEHPNRAIVTHLDTLGAMVRDLKDNGRLSITMIGTWSARFAEGARVKIFTDYKIYTGTILPLKASGHAYNTEIDTQAVSWDNLEIRIDEKIRNKADLIDYGFNVGDYIAVDPQPVISESGFINARHLDNKAGVAAKMAALKYIHDNNLELPVDCHPLFTITEEEGTGASSILRGDISAMVAIDNSAIAPTQNSSEYGVTICMRDRAGLYDYHLTHKLIGMCQDNKITHRRDVFRYYQSDASSALSSGNDIRTALICFALDSSHGYERTHIDSLTSLAELIVHYITSPPKVKRDKDELGPIKDFPHQL